MEVLVVKMGIKEKVNILVAVNKGIMNITMVLIVISVHIFVLVVFRKINA